MSGEDPNFFSERLLATSHILFTVFCDAIIFIGWMGIAMLMEWAASFAQQNGIHEAFATAFKWVSSSSTFLLATMYIIRDLFVAYGALTKVAKKAAELLPKEPSPPLMKEPTS